MHKPIHLSSGNEFNNNNTNISDRLVSETNLKENSLKESSKVKEDSKLNNFNGNLVNHKKESEKNKVGNTFDSLKFLNHKNVSSSLYHKKISSITGF